MKVAARSIGVGRCWVLIVVAVLAAGCETRQAKVEAEREETRMVHSKLGKTLDNQTILNATMLVKLAGIVAREVPANRELAAELAKEGTRNGRMYKLLGERIGNVDTDVRNDRAVETALEELARIRLASDPEVFSDALIDVINVIASLSGGRIAPIEVPSGAKAGEPGQALVGNPAFGQWRSDPGGGLSWFFFGMMANSMLSGREPYRYDSWYRSRPWSYHQDVGRSVYGTRSERTRYANAVRRNPAAESTRAPTPSRFTTRAKSSPYAAAATTGTSRASGTASRASSSPYAASTRRSSSSRGK